MARTASAYVIAIIAMVFGLWAVRVLPERLGRAWQQAGAIETVATKLDQRRDRFNADARAALDAARAEAVGLTRASSDQLDRTERAIRRGRDDAAARVLDPVGLTRAALTGGADEIAASYRARYVEVPLADRALAIVETRRHNLRERTSLNAAIARYNRQATAHRAKAAEIVRLRAEVRAQRRNFLCQWKQVPVVCAKMERLSGLASTHQASSAKLAAERSVLEARSRALSIIRDGADNGRALVEKANQAFAAEVKARKQEAGTLVSTTVRREFERSGMLAIVIVTAAFLAVPIGRALAYILIAPAAARAALAACRRW